MCGVNWHDNGQLRRRMRGHYQRLGAKRKVAFDTSKQNWTKIPLTQKVRWRNVETKPAYPIYTVSWREWIFMQLCAVDTTQNWTVSIELNSFDTRRPIKSIRDKTPSGVFCFQRESQFYLGCITLAGINNSLSANLGALSGRENTECLRDRWNLVSVSFRSLWDPFEMGQMSNNGRLMLKPMHELFKLDNCFIYDRDEWRSLQDLNLSLLRGESSLVEL